MTDLLNINKNEVVPIHL